MRIVGSGSPASRVATVSARPSASPSGSCPSTAAKRVRFSAVAAATSRRTCWSGVIPSVQTPGCACAGSLVKASIGTPALRAAGAAAAVSAAVSGPRIISSPLSSAARAASAAPSGVPPVSRGSSRTVWAAAPGGLPGGVIVIASSAARSIACPSRPAGPVSGSSSATRGPDALAPAVVAATPPA